MTLKVIVPVLGGLLVAIGVSQTLPPSTAHSQETKGAAKSAAKAKAAEKTKEAEKPKAGEKATEAEKPKAAENAKEAEKESPELAILRANTEAFEKAFNAGDAKALAALFAEKAEVVDEDGNFIEGRAEVEARFTETFKAFPKASNVVEITALRLLTPDVAVEDGYATVTLDPKLPPSRSPYSVVHIKRDGKWLFGSVRDFPEEVEATAHDHLADLDFLVGQWFDQSREGLVETDCKWSEDGNFLLQDFVVKARGGRQLKGTQRIGWDAARKTVRGWAFDQSGGIMESVWTPVDGGWVLKVHGSTAEGQAVSLTRIMSPVSNDSFVIDTKDQLVGDELFPDSSIKVVRRPPLPGK